MIIYPQPGLCPRRFLPLLLVMAMDLFRLASLCPQSQWVFLRRLEARYRVQQCCSAFQGPICSSERPEHVVIDIETEKLGEMKR